MVKISPFSAEAGGLNPGQGAKVPHALHPKKKKKKKPEKRNKILTNSKMIHLKKLLKKKYRIGSSFELGVMTERRAGLGRPESFQGRRGVSGRRSKQCLLQH